jgi:hypothetical protein
MSLKKYNEENLNYVRGEHLWQSERRIGHGSHVFHQIMTNVKYL